MQCLLLTFGRINRVHVAQVPVPFGMVCELAVETVTLTTNVSVQSHPLFLLLHNLTQQLGQNSMLSHMDEDCLPLLVL